MAGESAKTQAVFVIDASSSENSDGKWGEAVSLCVFRILCFLNSQASPPKQETKQPKQQLKWGYKFYSSYGNKTGSQAGSSFREFKLKYFEEFERNLIKNVSENCQPVRTRSQQNQNSGRKDVASSFPARSLSKSLTELVHDFQWEVPDFGSPVKRRKSSAGASSAHGSCRNLVFLFSKVPCDRKTLRYFANKVVIDADVFTESFMSSTLQKEFRIQRQIRLFWVDMGRFLPPDTTCNISPDKKSFEIVHQSVKNLGGNLLLFDALVTHLPAVAASSDQSPLSCVDSSNKQRNETHENCRRDVAISLSAFACTSVCNAIVLQSPGLSNTEANSSAGFPWCSNMLDKNTDVHIKLKVSGGTGSVDVPLDLAQVFKDDTASIHSANPEVNLHTLNGMHTVFGVSETPSADHQGQGGGKHSIILQPHCHIEKDQTRLLGTNITCQFLCQVQPSTSSTVCQAFYSLLQAAHQEQESLVLSVHDKRGSTSPVLAILEPVSPRSAHLSFLSLALTLQVEKHIILHNASDSAHDSTISKVSLEKFKQRAVAAIQGQRATEGYEDKGVASPNDGEEIGRFWPGLLNTWHFPGSVPQLKGTVDRLKDRSSNIHMPKAEAEVFLQLQASYRKENQMPVVLQPSQHSTPVLSSSAPTSQNNSFERINTSADDASASQDRPGLSRQSSLLARGRLMVSRAKRTPSLPTDDVDGNCPPLTQSENSRLDVSNIVSADFKSVEDLERFVRDQYSQSVNSGLGLEMNAQSLVTVTQHFFSTQADQAQPQSSTVQFLKKTLTKTSRELKALYKDADSDEDERKKVTEHKLQVLLCLEMESVLAGSEESDYDQAAEEVVDLLRGLLFGSESGAVPKFLSTTILPNYSATLPQLLVNIYEELSQPLPACLKGFVSPGTTASVITEPFSAASSQNSVTAPSSQPGSAPSDPSQRPRTRSLRPHPSLTGLSTMRQIVVQAQPAKKKSKNEGKPKPAHGHKPLKHKVKAEVKKARRNLFNTERKPHADKHRSHKHSDKHSKKTTPKKSTPRKKSHRSSFLSPGRRTPKKTIVAETPHHKQRTRKLSHQHSPENQHAVPNAEEVQVIEESPVKACTDAKISPGRFKPAMRIMRKAFYSAGQAQRSRNLARALELSDRIAGRHRYRRMASGGRLSDALSAGNQDELLSPTRQASAFLRAQLMRSPSCPKLATPTKPHHQRPDFTSPSQNTRSKTPQKGPFPKMRLFVDDLDAKSRGQQQQTTLSASSAVNALDFMSPVKHQSVPLVAETPPRVTRSATLVMNTPSKGDDSHNPVTPRKSGCVTPRKCGALASASPRKVAPSRKTESTSPKRKGESNSICVTPRKSGTPLTPPRKADPSTLRKMESTTPKKIGESSIGFASPKKGGAGHTGFASTTPRKEKTGSASCSTSKRDGRGVSGQTTPPRSNTANAQTGGGKSSGLPSRSPAKNEIRSSERKAVVESDVSSQTSQSPRKKKIRTRLKRTATGNFEVISPTEQAVKPKAVETQAASVSREKSPVTQSTILDYISPKDKGTGSRDRSDTRSSQGHDVTQGDSQLHHGQHTPKRLSRRRSLEEMLSLVLSSSERNQVSSTPTKRDRREYTDENRDTAVSDRPQGGGSASPIKTPTKSAICSQFMSPTRTPSKPILKNSPAVNTLTSPQGRLRSAQTPQKSPRVTFDMQPSAESSVRGLRSPSPTPGNQGVKTPDSMDKWHRKKKRWPSDSKSPNSSQSESPSGDEQGIVGLSQISDNRSDRTEQMQTRQSRSHDNRSSFQPEFISSTQFGSRHSKKRSSLFSQADNVSSPRKKRRTETGSSFQVSDPSFFSDNAMDAPSSYFSMSNDDVFLSASDTRGHFETHLHFDNQTETHPQDVSLSDGQNVRHKSASKRTSNRPGSPKFEGKSRGSKGLVRCKSSFADDLLEGSQGFEIKSHESNPPASPTFSTSPVAHDRTKSQAKAKLKSPIKLTGDESVSKAKLEGRGAENSRTDSNLRSPSPSKTSSPQPSSSKLTPLRIRGTPTDRKFSPTVSTTSLVHLMNSPILFENPKHKKEGDVASNRKRPSEREDSPTKPAKKKSRKMLNL